jgi:predicted metal-dependent hydrolase
MKIEYTSQPLKQNWDQDLPKYWFDNSPFKTHFLNAMSLMIPVAEYAVIHTLRETQKVLKNLELKKQITHMLAQENWHSYSHRKYNQWLESIGLPAIEISSMWLINLTTAKKRADRILGEASWLPAVVAGEHNAACFMEYVLERPALLQQMHPHFRQAWLWHSLEEIEHKGSSMDMWNDTKDLYNRKKWKLNLVLVYQSIRFHSSLIKYTLILLNKDKQLWKWRTLKDSIGLFFGRNGLFLNTVGPWFKFFKTDFHPWNHDTSYLIQQYQKIIDISEITPERLQQIEKDFEGCVADIESVIAQNNTKVKVV